MVIDTIQTKTILCKSVFGLPRHHDDPLLAKEIQDNVDHIDRENLLPLGRTHNVAAMLLIMFKVFLSHGPFHL